MNHLTQGQQFAIGLATLQTARRVGDAAQAAEKLAERRKSEQRHAAALDLEELRQYNKDKNHHQKMAELKKEDEARAARAKERREKIGVEREKEKAKERRDEAKEQRERDKDKAKERREKEDEAKRARKEKKKKKDDEREKEEYEIKKAKEPGTKAFAYFFTYFALKGRDELTEEEREKLSLQVNRATKVEEQYIWELLLHSALMQRLEEDEKKEDGKANQIKLLVEKKLKGLHVMSWLLKLEGVLADGEGANAEQEEWINSIQGHFKISNEDMAQAREKSEKDLFHKYFERGDDAKQFLYLYSQVVLLDGDGCTEIEREKIIELVLKRINATDLPISLGGKMTAAMAQKGLNSALIACKVDKMAETTQDAVIKSVTEKCFEFKYGEHIISDLEELATVDGAISAEQSEFLSFVNEQLVEAKEFGQKARLQAVAYLLMVLGFWDLNGITDEESAKIGELLLQWDDSLNEETLPELIKKCELSYEKDTREQNTEEVIRSIGFLREKLNEAQKTQLSHHMHELAAVDGSIAEQQQAFIQWAWEEITA